MVKTLFLLHQYNVLYLRSLKPVIAVLSGIPKVCHTDHPRNVQFATGCTGLASCLALHCYTVHSTALHCYTVHSTALLWSLHCQCSSPYGTALLCKALKWSALCCLICCATQSAVHYTTLHHTTVHYTTVQYTTLHYTTVQYTTVHYKIVHYTVFLLLHCTTMQGLHCSALHCTTMCSITLHCTVVYIMPAG